MRLKVRFISENAAIPLNYNYYLSSAIYKFLQFSSPEFSSFLHNKGFVLNGKPYKLFSFALRFEKMSVNAGRIKLLSPGVDLFIASPLIDDFIGNFISGSFSSSGIKISDGKLSSSLTVSSIESLPEPDFRPHNKFRLLSPLVLSTKIEKDDGSLHQYYFRFSDDLSEINRVLNQNLKNKFEIIFNKPYTGEDVILKWDDSYIKRKLAANKRLTKKISIIKKGAPPVEIIANEVPFTLSGNRDLIQTGYNCGFGEKNSMGFGLAELL